jgi:hypothetical protein
MLNLFQHPLVFNKKLEPTIPALPTSPPAFRSQELAAIGAMDLGL